MCGIAGWIDWKQDLTQEAGVLKAMGETMVPRGPDEAGTWASPRAGFAHRRLVVVDPAGGGQPMVRRRGDKTFVLVYNGELYNTADLRRELENRGHVFAGHSDTEVLLASFMEWGPSCVDRLNGIFAFAVWEEAEQRLFMARDRLGVKPLFYAELGNGLVFGSEIKALLAHPLVPPEIDAEGLAEIFVMGPARTPGHGVFRRVKELKPAHCLRYDRNGVHLSRYWHLESRPHEDDLETTAATVRRLLRDTVERQLVADVPICTLLSGGLDSSIVTAFAARFLQQEGRGPVHTFSVDYVDNDRHFRPNEWQPNDDGPWVKRVSDFLGTVHHKVFIGTEALAAALAGAVKARDLPGMAHVDSSLLLFSREIKKVATVGLSGEEADEIFGGYPWFFRTDALEAAAFPWNLRYRDRARLLAPEVREAIRPEDYQAQRYQEALGEVPPLEGEDPRSARMRQLLYLNITRFMPILLDRKDRMSMATGLEVKVPYCDHRLVEYVWNIPWEMKTWDGQSKGILRRSVRGILPEDVLERKKSPYPKTHHPEYLKATRKWLQDILDDPSSPLLPLVDTAVLRELVRNDAAAFDPAWFSQLMGSAQLFAYLGQVDTWLREYKVVIR